MRAYSWLLLGGTAGCIAVAVFFAGPATITLLARAIRETAASSPAEKANSVTAITVCCGFQAVWLRTWWRRHGGQVSDYLHPRRSRETGRR